MQRKEIPHPYQNKIMFGSTIRSEEKDKNERKNNTFFILMLVIGIPQTLFMNLTSFLPQYRTENHQTIHDGLIGIILSHMFFWISIVFRTLQGAGDSIIFTTGSAIICLEFRDEREKYMGYVQTSIGVGIMSGPVIGQLIFNEVGFQMTFMYFAFMMLIPLILASQLSIPSQYQKNSLNIQGLDSDNFQEIQMNIVEGFNYDFNNIGKTATLNSSNSFHKMFFSNPRIIIAAISKMMCQILVYFPDSCLADHFIKDLNVDSRTVGAACAPVIITFIPEIIDQIHQKQEIQEGEELSDFASSVNSITFGLSAVFAPILGGYLYEYTGFSSTCDILAAVSLFYACAYFILRILPEISKNPSHQKTLTTKLMIEEKKLNQKKLSEITTYDQNECQININIEMTIKSEGNTHSERSE
ncbi:permeases of the major facilitator superfamily [Stylonychia lemnae]|uniref:Permeases of the major facilitator superfamily n=1 Tax=Stylonychia lemnae TaxID=5949 RepID=A0A078B1L9_STYLE|nr:permeases of the major facilitator superfamily [Stylonychia lemnae]|eukprot:CDW87173.1 permeases of the major facilitator superfamily [Stylonychia lemnae]